MQSGDDIDGDRDAAELDKLYADVCAREVERARALDRLADAMRRGESVALPKEQIEAFCLDLGFDVGVPGAGTLAEYRAFIERAADESWAAIRRRHAGDGDSHIR